MTLPARSLPPSGWYKRVIEGARLPPNVELASEILKSLSYVTQVAIETAKDEEYVECLEKVCVAKGAAASWLDGLWLGQPSGGRAVVALQGMPLLGYAVHVTCVSPFCPASKRHFV